MRGEEPCGMTHLLSITAPAAFIRSNQHRDAWRTRATLTKVWREAAGWEARRQHLPAQPTPVHVVATIHPDSNRAYDLDGVAVTVKACIDGLRDVGVIPGDDVRFIPGLTLRHGGQWADATVVLTFHPIEGDAA
jgi:hypothetical protein